MSSVYRSMSLLSVFLSPVACDDWIGSTECSQLRRGAHFLKDHYSAPSDACYRERSVRCCRGSVHPSRSTSLLLLARARAHSTLPTLSFYSRRLPAVRSQVVSTTFSHRGGAVDFYKYTASSNSFIDDKEQPQARFSYDLSPMHVEVKEQSVAFYHFLTSVCAIIGGVFTVLGLMDSVVYHGITAMGGKQELGR